MATPEGKVKARLKARLKTLPSPFYQFWPVQSGMGASTLDMLGCYKGRFVTVETKALGKCLTPRQLFVMDQMERAGALAFVVSCDDDIAYMVAELQLQCP